MKKNKIIVGLLLLTQLIGLTACNDWLDLYPEDSVPKQFYWKTKEDVSAAVTGIYSSALSNVYNMLVYGESRADMLIPGRKNDSDIRNIWSGEITASNKLCNWVSFYNTINNCNIVLLYADKAKENDPSFTEKALKEYKAEAVAVRALMMFYLARTFGDVPFPEEAYVDDDRTLAIAKTPQKEILKKLADQLEQLRKEDSIPFKYSNLASTKGRMTRYAVDALLADIYLWLEDYTNCVTVCDEILNSGQYALIPILREEYQTDENETVYHAVEASVSNFFSEMFVLGNSVESIFELQFSRDKLSPFYDLFSPSATYIYQINNSRISFDIFPATQTSDRDYEDVRKQIATKLGYPWKYIGTGYETSYVRAQAEMTNNFIVYRLADVYLMKAEAMNQIAKANGDNQDMLFQALDLVNMVRDRSNAVETTAFEVTEGRINAAALEVFIMEERAREFLFEGKRWFDLLRNAKRDNYANLNYLTSIVPYVAPAEKVFSIQVKYKDSNSHYMPLPQGDVETNPLLVQNPFYDVSTSK